MAGAAVRSRAAGARPIQGPDDRRVPHRMMLLLLIPLAWLAVLTLVVALCLMASRADSAPALLLEMSGDAHDDRPPTSQGPASSPLPARRASHGRSRMRGTRLSRNRRRIATRDPR